MYHPAPTRSPTLVAPALFTQVETWSEDDPTHFTIVQTYPDGTVKTIYAAVEITCGDTVEFKTNECTDATFNACVHTSTGSSPIANLEKSLGREAGCYPYTNTDNLGVTTSLSGSVTGSPALDDPCATDEATATSSLSLMTAAAAIVSALALL